MPYIDCETLCKAMGVSKHQFITCWLAHGLITSHEGLRRIARIKENIGGVTYFSHADLRYVYIDIEDLKYWYACEEEGEEIWLEHADPSDFTPTVENVFQWEILPRTKRVLQEIEEGKIPTVENIHKGIPLNAPQRNNTESACREEDSNAPQRDESGSKKADSEAVHCDDTGSERDKAGSTESACREKDSKTDKGQKRTSNAIDSVLRTGTETWLKLLYLVFYHAEKQSDEYKVLLKAFLEGKSIKKPITKDKGLYDLDEDPVSISREKLDQIRCVFREYIKDKERQSAILERFRELLGE